VFKKNCFDCVNIQLPKVNVQQKEGRLVFGQSLNKFEILFKFNLFFLFKY
jgi:hypothetical protein